DGDAMLRLGKTDDALKIYQDALANFDIVFQKNPDNLVRQPFLAQAHERLGAVYGVLKKKAESEKHYKEALQLRFELYQVEPASLSRQAALVLAFAHAGKLKEATDNAARIGPRMTQSTELQLQLARCWAVCAAQETDKGSKSLDQAMAMLRAATKDGYQNAVLLQTDPDLEILRGQPAFKTILEQIKK